MVGFGGYFPKMVLNIDTGIQGKYWRNKKMDTTYKLLELYLKKTIPEQKQSKDPAVVLVAKELEAFITATLEASRESYGKMLVLEMEEYEPDAFDDIEETVAELKEMLKEAVRPNGNKCN